MENQTEAIYSLDFSLQEIGAITQLVTTLPINQGLGLFNRLQERIKEIKQEIENSQQETVSHESSYANTRPRLEKRED